ncbi:uncharacterized protein LOC124164469 [Ischnura elegans]|uniref:uncharacterized protein LOC124164469 n=1 Tax=Ischnura elegans TaxID=197161 RepID=UPI001ED8B9EA|nr:uncharacterized protein LOC124164469 [Ischnura elegans]
MAQFLQLKRKKGYSSVSGISGSETKVYHIVNATLSSRIGGYNVSLDFLVLPRISRDIPYLHIDISRLQLPSDIQLADPDFHRPQRVDGLLGAEVFWELLCPGEFRAHPTIPTLRNSTLGWIFGGRINSKEVINETHSYTSSFITINEQLQQFWLLEECPTMQQVHSPEQLECEEHFVNNFKRDKEGRFILKLPLKESVTQLGESRDIAIRRFLLLERRLQRDRNYRAAYIAFMDDYEKQLHMEVIPDPESKGTTYYIPHHAVIKPSSSTTKLRVVFDASCPSSSGVSLNDVLMIDDDDTNLQRIIWRSTPDSPLLTYRLKTVTYGTSSAPYLATRCLRQLAYEEAREFPLASAIALKDFYVDDLITGADTFEEALEINQQMISMFKRGGFQIRKWCTNNVTLLSRIPESLREKNYHVHSDGDFTVKSLGLGFIGPVIIKAKIFLQRLWELKGDWDDPLPATYHAAWCQFREELPLLEKLKVPRWVDFANSRKGSMVDLHGFCDASEGGYGACVYIRTSSKTGYNVHLLCSKSKVSPLKKISIPRLELLAAKLLSKLIYHVSRAGNFEGKYSLWSDSQIVLTWLSGPSYQWKTFVANRVTEINELTKECVWRHVRSNENPADHVSRGLSPQEILTNDTWWNGPPWLSLQEDAWPAATILVSPSIPEQRKKTTVFLVTRKEFDLLHRYSSLDKLLRITAYCLRFFHNSSRSSVRFTGPLSAQEVNQAMLQLIKVVQRQMFAQEFRELSNDGEVGRRSRLRTLSPFLDTNMIIRVGGRIKASEESYDTKHPIVLPGNDYLSKLIAMKEHLKHLHCAPQALLSSLRLNFWPLNGRTLARKVVHQCLKCFRCNPKVGEQKMGNLPKERVQPSRPFLNTGIDYCGPVHIRSRNGRGSTTLKAYIAVFVCFATKAIHLELVGNLTSESFIGCLRRFMARRGKCANLYSDNATNFKGAHKELHKLFTSASHEAKLNKFLIEDNIKWHFIPPRSPHFGGLWEAGVKSRSATKRLSRRQYVQQLHQHFWGRWSKEYLTGLQQRTLWIKKKPNLSPGDLVMLKEENLPPLKWNLGRVIEVYPGEDGLVRVASVKTACGVWKRAISKLCPLPTEE